MKISSNLVIAYTVLALFMCGMESANAGMIGETGSSTALTNAVVGSDPMSSFSFNDGFGITGSGTLTGIDLGGGVLGITSGSITLSGAPAGENGLYSLVDVTPGPGYSTSGNVLDATGNWLFDNLLYTSGPASLDLGGLLFSNANGIVNIWYVAGSNPYYEFGHSGFTPGSFDILQPFGPSGGTSVPEPSTLALLALGGIGLTIARRRRSVVAA